MSKRFTRNIKDTKLKGKQKEPLYTNNQNDLLSDDKDAYIRNQGDYHCLTDNIKSITTKTDLMTVKTTGKNSRQIVFKDDEVVKQEEYQTFKNDEFNPLVDVVNNETVKQNEFQEFKDNDFNPLVEKIENISNNDDGFTKVNQMLDCLNFVCSYEGAEFEFNYGNDLNLPSYDLLIEKGIDGIYRLTITLNNVNIQVIMNNKLFIKTDKSKLLFDLNNSNVDNNQITYDSDGDNSNLVTFFNEVDTSEDIDGFLNKIGESAKLFIEGYNISE